MSLNQKDKGIKDKKIANEIESLLIRYWDTKAGEQNKQRCKDGNKIALSFTDVVDACLDGVTYVDAIGEGDSSRLRPLAHINFGDKRLPERIEAILEKRKAQMERFSAMYGNYYSISIQEGLDGIVCVPRSLLGQLSEHLLDFYMKGGFDLSKDFPEMKDDRHG